ncbi:uncharacterized protein LOC128861356 [Anastrepha ludens]|uniref:uncharacterized protein LOC128861356 n=1 Tax=Anastrepha ludens TaxID=28586 RepID=UPI0023AEB432|nr:uncharacterized protein LOC128861356 [Anastrepha ludens]XP_053955422.1 uncharacterized protein LOC128861356 [Anastrepha ludens]
MRLLTLTLLWLLGTSAAALTKEMFVESEPADNPTTTVPNIVNDTQSKIEFSAAQDKNVAGGNEVVNADEAEHMATAIVAPLTHIAHVTYDSVPVTHKPNDHKPLFHRESHDELIKL